MKTAVEWLLEEMSAKDWFDLPKSIKNDIVEQAKAMEKEQIMDAYNQGCNDYDELGYKRIEEYYNETYKNTGL